MPPAHVTACKGPLLHQSRLRNGTGGSGHPQPHRAPWPHCTTGKHRRQHRGHQAEASSASEVAVAPCP